ncbi:glycosyltransferase family 2 protein [soil metagenome]
MHTYLSIIIPAFNEENRLPETLALVRDWVERQKFSVEVLVVDDGSTDGTVAVVQEIAHRFPGLRVITNEVNKGKGGVVAQGMLEAAGEWRLFMDADASTPIAELQKLLKHTGKFEVIIGSRYLNPDSIKVKQPLKRRIVSRLWNVVIQTSLLPGIRDTQCGFKLFSAAASQAIFSKQQVDGWLFDVEILTIARHLSYAIKEVPVDWYDSRDSKLRAMRAGMRALKDLSGIRRRLQKGSY